MAKFTPTPLQADMDKYQKKLKIYEAQLEKYTDDMTEHAFIVRQQHAGRLTEFRIRTDDDVPYPPEPPEEPPLPDPPKIRMKAGEMDNFAKLSSALASLLGRTTTKARLKAAVQSLTEYLIGYRNVGFRSLKRTSPS